MMQMLPTSLSLSLTNLNIMIISCVRAKFQLFPNYIFLCYTKFHFAYILLISTVLAFNVKISHVQLKT